MLLLQVKSHSSATNVLLRSFDTVIFSAIFSFTVMINHTSVSCVQNPSHSIVTCRPILTNTLVKDHINVNTVLKVSRSMAHYKPMNARILEKNHSNVSCVRKLLSHHLIFDGTSRHSIQRTNQNKVFRTSSVSLM